METTSYPESYPETACQVDGSIHSAIAPTSYKSTIFACMIGNALEWYDFVIYGYFAAIFGFLFFPSSNPTTQILASWGVFWSGFIARPLGSIIFGHIGDKTSRKHALTLSIYIMAVPTALIGLLPTYANVGILATIALVLLRTMQGFALGGEFTGSMVFLVEHAPKDRRGMWGSWVSCSAVIGVILGSSLVAILSASLSTASLHTWGWRLPFIISILGSVVAVYMRNNLQDPQEYLAIKARRMEEHTPLKQIILRHKSKIGITVLLDFINAIAFFIIVIFFATYFNTFLSFAENITFLINTANMCVLAAATLAGGWLADRVGIRKTLAYPCIGFILFSYPLFVLLQSNSYLIALGVQAIFAIMLGVFFGTIPVALSSIMPTNIRCSGLSIGHNLSMAIFGGGTPFMATGIIKLTNNIASPAYLLIVAGLLSLSSLFFLSERT